MSSRNKVFRFPDAQRNAEQGKRIRAASINGAVPFLNPTKAFFQDLKAFENPLVEAEKKRNAINEKLRKTRPCQKIAYKWTARNNRKGHHAIAILPSSEGEDEAKTILPPEFTSFRCRITAGIRRMFFRFPVWDISYTLAVLATLGSAIWIFDGVVTFVPLAWPGSAFPGASLFGGGIAAFIGTLIFVVVNILQVLEVFNEKRSQCFGWDVMEGYSVEEGPMLQLKPSDCKHHHADLTKFVGHSADSPTNTPRLGTTAEYPGEEYPFSQPEGQKQQQQYGWSEAKPHASSESPQPWAWLPSYNVFSRHYARDLGFLASMSQLLGVLLFLIGAFARLPGIYNRLSAEQIVFLMWVPKIVGCLLFIESALLFMLEIQTTWWCPEPWIVGWHNTGWNLAGAIGFTLSVCFGFHGAPWAVYQSSLATLWAGTLYLIGSFIQWYEALEKHSVVRASVNEVYGPEMGGDVEKDVERAAPGAEET